MILWNWIKCVEGKFQYARTENYESDITESDLEAWNKIYDSYVNHFGISKVYKRYLNEASNLAKAQLTYIETNDRRYLNTIRIQESKIEDLKKEMNKGITTESVIVHLSKFMGFHQDTKKITVLEYFNMIKEYENSNKN